MISVMVGHFDCKHRCLSEKNIPIAFILPSRWQDGVESVVIETPLIAVYGHGLLFYETRQSWNKIIRPPLPVRD